MADQHYLRCLIFWTGPPTKEKDKCMVGRQNGAYFHLSSPRSRLDSAMNVYNLVADLIFFGRPIEWALKRL